MRFRLPLFLLCSLAIGILIALLCAVKFGVALTACGVGILLYSISSGSPFKSIKVSAKEYLDYAWMFLFTAGMGALLYDLSAPSYPFEGRHHLTHQQARVLDRKSKTSGEQYLVELTGHNVKATVLMTTASLNRDDHIVIHSALLPTDPERSTNVRRYKQSADSAKVEGFKKYSDYQRQRGILYSGHVFEKDIEVTGRYRTLSGFSRDLRDELEIFIEKTELRHDVKRFLITLILGDKEYVDPELRQHFSDVGLGHVLAVSGLHTGLIAGIILFLLFPLNVFRRRKMKFILTLILLWLFVIVTGCAPSTVRAAIMMSFIFIGLLTERYAGAEAGLCWAAFFILLFSPTSLFDPGFQLSFLCVASLLLFSEKLNPIDRTAHGRHHSACAVILTTLIATACTWPVVGYYFGSLPTMFLATNLLILPLLPLFLFSALLYLILAAIGIEWPFLSSLLERGYTAADSLTSYLSADGATVLPIAPTLTTVILWLAGILALAIALHAPGKYRPITALTAALLLVTSLLTLL